MCQAEKLHILEKMADIFQIWLILSIQEAQWTPSKKDISLKAHQGMLLSNYWTSDFKK